MELKLGEKVFVSGKFEKAQISPMEVEHMKWNVRNGATEISRKFNVVRFGQLREGIVVGKRSVMELREHTMSNFVGDVTTKPFKRRETYLIACDLRGTIKVPVECIIPVELAEEDEGLELDDEDFDIDDEAFDGSEEFEIEEGEL